VKETILFHHFFPGDLRNVKGRTELLDKQVFFGIVHAQYNELKVRAET